MINLHNIVGIIASSPQKQKWATLLQEFAHIEK